METLSIHRELRRLVADNLLYGGDSSDLSDDDSFLEKGVIDSTSVLELVSLIESEFKIRIEDAELIPENLDTINNLARFVERKQQCN